MLSYLPMCNVTEWNILLEINLHKAIHVPQNHCDIIILVFNDMNILMTQMFKMTQDVGKLLGKVCNSCEMGRGEKADRISVKGYVATGTPSLGWYIGCKHFEKNTTFSLF